MFLVSHIFLDLDLFYFYHPNATTQPDGDCVQEALLYYALRINFWCIGVIWH